MSQTRHDRHVGLYEIAEMFGVQRKTAVQWQVRKLLPKPCCSVSRNPSWTLTAIKRWGKDTGRLRASETPPEPGDPSTET